MFRAVEMYDYNDGWWVAVDEADNSWSREVTNESRAHIRKWIIANHTENPDHIIYLRGVLFDSETTALLFYMTFR